MAASTRTSPAISRRSRAWRATTCRRKSKWTEFNDMGCDAGVNVGNITTRPTFIVNDAVTWVKSTHTLKVGMEWRKIMGNIHANGNEAGSFIFGRGATGILGVNSGSEVASFLLGAVDNANVAYRSVPSWYPRQHAWILHAGDTWRVNKKLTVDYGVRWDYYSPSSEKIRSPVVLRPDGPESGRGWTSWPARLRGRRIRRRQLRRVRIRKRTGTADSPRGSAPSTRSTTRRCFAGAGESSTRRRSIPVGAGACRRPGSRTTRASAPSLGGIQPAMYLNQGFPVGNFDPPPDIRSDYLNGQDTPVPPDRGEQAPVLAPVEHHGRSRAGPPIVAEPGLRRQRRPPAPVEHRAAERHRSELPLAWRPAERRVHARDDEPQRRALCPTRAGSSR